MLDLQARLQAIAGNPRNSAQATATARSEAASAIEQLEQRAQDAAGRIYARLDKATEGAPDVQQAILDELRESRAFGRVKMALDAGQDVLEIIRAAGARQDRAALRAMRADLPSYLEAQTGGTHLVKAAQKALDNAEMPLLGQIEKYARDLRKELSLGMAHVSQAANFAKHEASGASVYGLLPDWAEGAINVAEQGPRA
jgi:hypothetical protein